MLGIAYCGTSNVIAVSLFYAHAVVLLQYESGAVKPEVTIGSGVGSGDGQLREPHGVTFTADGCYILVADCGNHRVSKFSAATGAFIAHVISNGILWPRDVMQLEGGSILVTQGRCFLGLPSLFDVEVHSGKLVGEDGSQLQRISIPNASHGGFMPYSLVYSPFLKAVVVRTLDGNVFLFRDAWMASSRSAWLSALSCC
jgi:hypothetical protein